MGVILTIRHSMGLIGPDDGGLASALRNVGQLELYGAVVAADPIEELGKRASPAAPAAPPTDLRG
jgi:hypothetical protein